MPQDLQTGYICDLDRNGWRNGHLGVVIVATEAIAPLDPNPSAFPTNFLHKSVIFHSVIQPAFLLMLNPQRPPCAMLPPPGRPDARTTPLAISSAPPFACFRDLMLFVHPLLMQILLPRWRIARAASAPALKTEVMASPALT
jgi:hypothetical protein